MPDAPAHLSPSSIDTWQQCPLKYRYSRIDRLPDPPGDAALLGTFVHKTLEVLHRRPRHERSLQDMREVMRQEWDVTYSERMAQFYDNDPEELNRFQWRAWQRVLTYYGMEDPAQISTDGVEVNVSGQIGGVTVKGIVDRSVRQPDGTLLVTDYKTGKTPAPRFRQGKFQQLLIYAYLLSEGLDSVTACELLYLGDGTRLHHEVTKRDLREVEGTVVQVRSEIDAAIQADHFRPVRQTLCKWCSFQSICPEWQ